MASSVHGSYDFYNNGTSYFNGTVIVDDHLSVTGTSAQLTLSRTSTDQTAGFNLTNNQNGGYGSGIVWNSKRSDAGLLTAAEITVSGENSWNSDATSSSMMQFATRKDNTLTTHMTIRKTGNVGIGTTAPSVGLQVGNSTLGETKTVIFNSEGGAEVGLSVTSRTNRAKIRVSDNDTSGYLVSEGGVFGVGMTGSISNNNINILANGNIGMGTSAPQSFTKLDVRSNGSLSGSSAIAAYGYHGASVTILGNGYASSGTGTNIGVKGVSTGPRASDSGSVNIGGNFYATGAENNYALITGAGNVGIGTATPSKILEVSGPGGSGGTIMRLNQENGSGASGPTMDFGYSGQAWRVGANVYATGDFVIYDTNATTKMIMIKGGGNVGIGTTDPKANLHVNVTGSSDGFLAGGKNLSLSASYGTGAQLEVTLGNHQGCYVKVFITGDWSGHSAMAFLGEYFIQNGADAYAEPGMIIREVENTNGIDSISSRIYDGGAYDSFQIQFKLNVPSGGVTSAAGNLTYQIMGQFDAIS
jgi:hypothetical protein